LIIDSYEILSKYDKISLDNSVMHYDGPIRFFSHGGITMVTINENGRFVKKEFGYKSKYIIYFVVYSV